MATRMILPARTQKEIERSITHFDQDYELDFYSKRKMIIDPRTGKIEVVQTGSDEHVMSQAVRAGISPLALWSRDVKGTLFTGIPAELLYHDQGTANTQVAGTAAEVQMNLTNPFGQPAYLPAGFWLPGAGPIGRTAKVVLRGIATTAAAAGTAIFTTRLGARDNVATATIVGITPTACAATPVVATLAMWEQELDIELQAFGTVAASSVLRGLGKVGFPGWSSTAPWFAAMPFYTAMTGQTALSNGLTAATVDITANNYLSCNQNCTAATVTAIQLLQMFVYGMG